MGLIITPGGNLPEYSTTNPANAGSGVFPFAKKRTGQTLLSSMGLIGSADVYQPHLGFKRTMRYNTIVNVASGTADGLTGNTGTGTATARAFATTDYLTQSRRIGMVTTASTAGLTASLRQPNGMVWRGNAAGLGGFYMVIRFGLPQTLAAGIFLFGVTPAVAITAATAASAGTDIFCVGKDAADTTFQLMNNDSSGTATKTDTLVAWASNTAYALRILCLPNDTVMYISLENMATGAIISDTSFSTNLPTNTTALTFMVYISNNATASTTSLDLLDIYIQSDS